jgi:molybdopterin-guanine dinucleotide biosynthesis protein A
MAKLMCEGRPVSLILLAGGKSRRMKTDKAHLPVPEGTMIQRILGQVEGLFDEILVSVSRGRDVRLTGCRIVPDEMEGGGPLIGIRTGLTAAANDVCFVLACDIPDIDTRFLAGLVRKASGFEVVVPVSKKGFLEPLFAVYRKSVVPLIDELVGGKEYSILPLIERCRTLRVRIEDDAWLRNINTPEDYAGYLESLAVRKRG